jgi:hypothetical protein
MVNTESASSSFNGLELDRCRMLAALFIDRLIT